MDQHIVYRKKNIKNQKERKTKEKTDKTRKPKRKQGYKEIFEPATFLQVVNKVLVHQCQHSTRRCHTS